MIIIGLGNPGKEYDHTRHNVGFEVVEKLAEKLQASWRLESGAVLVSTVGPHFLIRPQEFMNMSGTSIKKFLDYKKITFIPDEFMVVHDDVDFPLGEIHEQHDRSAAGHNGVQSMIDVYGQNFYRLRIGIGNNRDVSLPAEAYVLQKFSPPERAIIDTAINQAVEVLDKKISS